MGTRRCTGACAPLLAFGPALNLGLIPRASQVALAVQKLPASTGDIRDPGIEDRLEEEMATHSNILAWETPWTEEPGRLQSTGSQKSQDMTEQLSTHTYREHR